MIIMKAKLKMNSLSGLRTRIGGLGGKIRANYLLGNAGAGAEELLHPAASGGYPGIGGQPVHVANRYEEHTDIRIETVNQLMNRFELYGTEHFTFQDEVFVSRMLNKAGVQNIGTFMDRLAGMVREDGEIKEKASDSSGYSGIRTGRTQRTEKDTEPSEDFQDRIYKRMKLAELTEAVYELNAGRKNKRGERAMSAEVLEAYAEIFQDAETEETDNGSARADIAEGNSSQQEFKSPEQLKKYLDGVNARNMHMKRLMDEALEEAEKPRKADKQAVHRAALLALEHPEQALEEMAEREGREPAGQNRRIRKLMELTEPALRPLYEAAFEFQALGGQYAAGRPVLRAAAQTEFIRELKEAELTVRDIQKLRLPGDEKTETAAGGETVPCSLPAPEAGRGNPAVGLVHNRQRQEMFEELMEEMQDVRRKVKVSEEKKASVKRSVTDKTVSRPAKYEAGAAGIQNGRAIERMVQQSMNQQVGHMSEQIYRRLEKRLKDEQRRRGF